MSDIRAPWDDADDVTDYTDTDLVATRNHSSRASDPSRQLHRMAATIVRSTDDIDTASTALDRAARVGIADLIDQRTTTISREEFDVAYTIPPAGWITGRTFPELELCPVEETTEVTGITDESPINYTTAEVVAEMLDAIVADGAAETRNEIIIRGAGILVGE